MKQHALKVKEEGLAELLRTRPEEAPRIAGAYLLYRCGRGLVGVEAEEAAECFRALDPDWSRGPSPPEKEAMRRKELRTARRAPGKAMQKLEQPTSKAELRCMPPLDAACRLLRVPDDDAGKRADLEKHLAELGGDRFRNLLDEVFDSIAREGKQGEDGRYWPKVKSPLRLFFKRAAALLRTMKPAPLRDLFDTAAPTSSTSPSVSHLDPATRHAGRQLRARWTKTAPRSPPRLLAL